MNTLLFDALSISRMASGHLCLNLSERVTHEDFPDFANHMLGLLNGVVVDKAEDPSIRLWQVRIRDVPLRLVFDDYPLMVTFESQDNEGDRLIEELYKRLGT